jgi:hypothetical protein
MSKIINSAFTPTSYVYDLENNVGANNGEPYKTVSQTPKNYSKYNYYLHTLQDKVDADWKYRPNRVDVEEEEIADWGTSTYTPIEVVIQTIKNDKGEKLADDYKKIIFRDIGHDKVIGMKYRFSFNFDLEEPDEDKFCWLITNQNSTDMTDGVVITRCNGTISSVYKNTDGYNDVHIEEVVAGTDLSGTGFHFNETILTQKDSIAMIVQANAYTRQYYINQRFIVGYDTVYKVTNIENYNSRSTYKATDNGLIVLYATIDQKSEQDMFDKEIYGKQHVYLAYNKPEDRVTVTKPVASGDYVFKFYEPTPLPTELYSDPITFKAGLYQGGTLIETPISLSITLGGLVPFASYDKNSADGYAFIIKKNGEQYYVTDLADYEKYVEVVSDDDKGTFALRRLKVYTRKDLIVTAYITAENSPTSEELSQSFVLSLRGLE